MDLAALTVAGKQQLGVSVLDAALARLTEQYEAGHRLVVSISGGKDSTVTAELAIIAARETGRLPVEVITREEEIIFPGTCEYMERFAARPEVSMTWAVAHQPIINCFDRASPYWWVCDPQLDPADWVRQPPAWAVDIPYYDVRRLINRDAFPPPEGRDLIKVMGLRAQESRGRMMAIHSSKGPLTKPDYIGVRALRPIYDWRDGDIWKAIHDFGWDYNPAYDVMHRLGVKPGDLRISPPTMNPGSGDMLAQVGGKAWPEWWDRVCRRLPSVRTYAMYGKRAVLPDRRSDETWEQCYRRTCIEAAPEWIAERSEIAMKRTVEAHARHASTPLPQASKCFECGVLGSWRQLTRTMYGGDPFSVRVSFLPYVEPSRFRPGEPNWGGPPG